MVVACNETVPRGCTCIRLVLSFFILYMIPFLDYALRLLGNDMEHEMQGLDYSPQTSPNSQVLLSVLSVSIFSLYTDGLQLLIALIVF